MASNNTNTNNNALWGFFSVEDIPDGDWWTVVNTKETLVGVTTSAEAALRYIERWKLGQNEGVVVNQTDDDTLVREGKLVIRELPPLDISRSPNKWESLTDRQKDGEWWKAPDAEKRGEK